MNYRDSRGAFQFGYEDGRLLGTPHQIAGEQVLLNEAEIHEIVGRVAGGIESKGNHVEVIFPAPEIKGSSERL